MKNLFCLMMCLSMTLMTCACESNDKNEPEVTPPATPEVPQNATTPSDNQSNDLGKTLIVYYSFTNNVHKIVNELKGQIEADVIRIEPAEEGLDYAANNYAIGSALIQAISEKPSDASSYPAIKEVDVNLSDYKTIIVGTPLWWSNMAAPMQTFLFQHGSEMANKNIGLIVSSASSGIDSVLADAKRLIPNGKFMEPNLWIKSSEVSKAKDMLANWLKNLK